MKSTKRRALSFIAVLPAMVLASCAQSAIKTSNPPEPDPTTRATPEPATKTTNPPEPPKPEEPKYPPVSYSKREQQGADCFVQVYVNPPYQVQVSCTAPIEPAQNGGEWCSVASAKDPAKRESVDCASK